MGCCNPCDECFEEGRDQGYEEGRRSVDLAGWAFENRHQFSRSEVDLLERVSDLMRRGVSP